MKKFIIILILVLAAVLRFWHLGANPPSLDWDEASLGYNAYSILKTGKDEYGTRLPLSIRSFGDYKPPLYTYLTIPSVMVFDLTEFAVRLPSAIMGVLAVLLSYFLVQGLFKKKSQKLYLLTMFFFAISPWHIQFSRTAFEANVALSFFLAGLYFLLKGLQRGSFLVFSSLSFVLSIYSYHSPRLVVPLILFVSIVIYLRNWIKKIKWVVIAIALFVFSVFPLVKNEWQTSGARFGSVTLLNPSERLTISIRKIEYDLERNDVLGKLMHNRRIVFARDILGGYFDHFRFDFLFLTGDLAERHHAADVGNLYFWDLPFIIAGFILLIDALAKKKNKKNTLFLLVWFLLAPSASAITKATPHSVRSLLYLPSYQILSALGFLYFFQNIRKKIIPFTSNFFTGIVFFLMIFNFFYYLHMYWVHTPIEYSKSWQYGYKQAVNTVKRYEDEADKIIVTYRYDQPYIYFLFYNKVDPFWYQSVWQREEIKRGRRIFGKYEFRDIDWEKDSKLEKAIIVGASGPYDEIPDSEADIIDKIYFLDGNEAFDIAKTF